MSKRRASGGKECPLEPELYASLPGDFYHRQLLAQVWNPVLRFGQHWLRGRQRLAGRMARRYYSHGFVLDIGAGNSLWNTAGLPTIGLDVSTNMLRYNAGRLPGYAPLRADFRDGLPLGDGSVGLVVLTEVIEHVPTYPLLLAEVHRVLWDGGVVVVSVPYGRLPGIWGLLFPLWCRYKAVVRGDQYYASRCGHCVDFNRKQLRRALGAYQLEQMRVLEGLTIICAARKRG